MENIGEKFGMSLNEIDNIDFQKGQGLIPAVIQDSLTGRVLMLGYQNRDALEKTLSSGRVCFFSRSKNDLWVKGETSGNFLNLVGLRKDCDSDAVVILVQAEGPVCHLGTQSCFGELKHDLEFLGSLAKIIDDRISSEAQGSYTKELFDKGIKSCAQKVGEEGVEVALAATSESDEALLGETADLIFHTLVCLKSRGLDFKNVINVLESRHKSKA